MSTELASAIGAGNCPRHFGRYEAIAEIARGGMGTVYLGRHAGEAGFQRMIALKVLHPHLAEDSSFVDMLHDEACLAARIHHPNVVAIVDLGVQDGLYYVAMEYVEGAALSLLLRRNPSQRLPGVIAQIMIDTLEGLHAAHTLTDETGRELQLVHRDVSPQNVLLGVDGWARITDFGIAKAETRITSTVPGVRKGKVAYMSPEQIVGAGAEVDRRADVFSAGTLLWSALTGLSLFRGETDAATLHNVLHRAVEPPSRVGLEPPDFLDDVVLRALERDPAARWQTAREMADAIRRAAAASSTLASRAEVADWVDATFKQEFEARRRAIREADLERRGAGRSLPALPVLRAPKSWPPQSSSTLLTPGTLETLTTRHSLTLRADSTLERRRKRLIGVAAVGVALGVGAIGHWQVRGPRKQTGAPTPATIRPLPAAPAPAIASHASAPAPASRTAVLEPPAPRARASRPRLRSSLAPDTGRAPLREVSSGLEDLPILEASPEQSVERNPYLRER